MPRLRPQPIRLLGAIAVVMGTLHAGPLDARAAQRLQGTLLTAYAQCAPGNATLSAPFPVPAATACTANRVDRLCGFGPKGSGTFALTVFRRGMRVRAKLDGLDAGCETRRLSLIVAARVTTPACAGGACTVIDSEMLVPAPSCVVTRGRCRIRDTLDAAALTSEALDVAVRNVRVQRERPEREDQAPVRTFEMGFILLRAGRAR